MEIVIRDEEPSDVEAVHRVNVAAFPTDAEAKLVRALRDSDALVLSLVAEHDGEIVGHIAFSPVSITSDDATMVVAAIGLGPMAVAPPRQRSGIGAQLIEEGLRRLREAGHRLCVVLGHPEYYLRAGFVRASKHDIWWERDAPEPSFMIQPLVSGALDGVHGTVSYRPEFDDV